jgi:hypothetical protein
LFRSLAVITMKFVLSLAAAAVLVAVDTCESPVQRKNFTSLTNDEKLAWLSAEVCLTTHDAVFGLYDEATTLWDEQQYLHLTMSNYIHGVVRCGPRTRSSQQLTGLRVNFSPGTDTT